MRERSALAPARTAGPVNNLLDHWPCRFLKGRAMNDEAREIFETACDAVVVEMSRRRYQEFLDEGLTDDEAVERMRDKFFPEARQWHQRQMRNFDLMHRSPPPSAAVN
jgi:hypothetical protein